MRPRAKGTSARQPPIAEAAEPRSGAHIEGSYRYRLWRTVNPDARPRRLLFLMLNPSTADADLDDPTLRRCIGFASLWGYRSLEVCNLFAYRATDPDMLVRVADPVGPHNDVHILAAAARAESIIAAWGTRGALGERASHIVAAITRQRPLLCLGLTKGGTPRHPLYVRRDAAPRLFAARAR
jgi:hypothetical protein